MGEIMYSMIGRAVLMDYVWLGMQVSWITCGWTCSYDGLRMVVHAGLMDYV
jgi:hypothetical protein